MNRRRSIIVFAIVASLLIAATPPVSAAHAPDISSNETAAELGNGTLSNAEVERSGAGADAFAGYDTARTDAVARWAFDLGSGSTAYDHVGSNDGTITGATWTTGISGQALDFDGSDDQIDTGFTTLQVPVTITAWVNPDTTGENNFVIGNFDSGADDFFFGYQNNDELVVAYDGGMGAFSPAGHTANANAWTHIAVTIDGSEAKLYANGSLVGSTSNSATANIDNGVTFKIANQGDGTDDFDGTIDDVRVYSAALSPGQISRLYRNPNPKLSANATERWAFDAGTGTTAYGDEGNDGTISGGTWVTGQSGTAISLNGGGEDVAVPHSADFNTSSGSITLSAWIKPTSGTIDGGAHRILSKQGSSSALWHVRVNSNSLQMAIKDQSGTLDSATGATTLSAGTWYHVVGVYDATANEVRIYLNGSEDGSSPTALGNIDNNHDVRIGSNQGTGEYFNGTIDDPRLYNSVALTAQEAVWLYDNPGEQLNDTGSYTGADHAVTNTVSGWTDLELENATATVTWQNGAGATLASTTVSSTQNLTQSWSRDSTSAVNVTVDFEPTDPDHTARLFDEGVSADTFAPTVDNASLTPNTTASTVSGLPVTLEADINDTDFPTAQGDSVDAEFFVDGSSVGTDTLTSNGTASVSVSSLMGGSHDWNVTLTDSYGHSQTSATAEFLAPSNLTFRNESNPDEILSGITVEIEAYYGTETDTRTVTDGNLSLTGFPVDEPIVIRANTTDYYQRTAVIESVFDQDEVYLLNRTVSTNLNRFDLEDPTGDYPAADTVLFVDRALNQSGSVEWRIIAGDNFGIQGIPVYLEDEVRYRLRIKNLETGQTTVIGSYTSIQSETVTFSVAGSVDPPTSERAYNWQITENETSQELVFLYNDTEDQTVEVKLTIRERFNASNVLVNNQSFTSNDIHFIQSLTNDEVNKTWVADIYIDRGDGFMHFTEVATSGQSSIIPLNLDQTWLDGIAVFVLLMVAMAFSQFNQGIGAITVSTLGGVFWLIGILGGSTTAVAVVIALVISLVFHYRGGTAGAST